MNDYYDPKLKEYHLELIKEAARTSPVSHVFIKGDLADKALIDKIFTEYKPTVVVTLLLRQESDIRSIILMFT